jgi:hypothetical protein
MNSKQATVPDPSRPSSARNRAVRTFVFLLIAVLLVAVGADMVGIENAATVGWVAGLLVATIGGLLAYRGVIR